MSPKHILIVGGGGIGERHLRVFGRIPGVSTSLCEPRLDRAQELQSRYPVESAYHDFFVPDLSLFDGVVLCTPANLHIEMATHAAKQNCPFLLEKPLSTTLEGCEELVALVEERRLVAGVAYVFRHSQPFVDLKTALERGDIGEVRTLNLEGGQYFPSIRPDHTQNYFSRYETGGGVLLDFMSHGVNLLEWMNGRETEVSCMFDRLQLRDIETDDVGLMLLKYQNGSLGHLQQDAFRRDYFFHVTLVGSEGTLLFEYERGRLGYYPANATEWSWKEYAYERDDFFTAQAEHFLKTLEGEEPVRCTLEEALWTLRVILLARQSATERRHVLLRK
ncbi:MAG: Gfo/Idh/MocA family oxidoreductase [Armatimonadetes bacterium]|nr:Gfo/Idh/MocA family oxidoreductase [Armatimonadota bacterium]